jgi:4-carboxymuconolactone decarboxylase
MDPLPPMLFDALSAAQREVFEEIVSSRPAEVLDPDGCLTGPFNAMLLSPAVGGPLQRLGAALRRDSSLPDRARELAILCVASHWRSAFEWTSHVSLAAAAGLSPSELERLWSKPEPEFEQERDRRVHDAVQALLAGRAPRDRWDQAELFELSTLVGYYATLALQLRVFGVDSSD